jgi:hypothetical protein
MAGAPLDLAPLPNRTIFLPKPVSISQLLTAVEQLLDANLSTPEPVSTN